MKGDTGENLLVLLESRLDAFIYRCNFAPTIFCAKQFVSHKHVLVNNKTVNISSYRLKLNDVVELKEKSQRLNHRYQKNEYKDKKLPNYISIENNCKAQYTKIPKISDISYSTKLEPNYVVEFYSR